MEDQHMYDIMIPPELPQDEYIQEPALPLILRRKKRMIPKWSELPPTVLEKIYSYLDRKNRSQMSLVCRKWCQVYSAPSLWRTMKVYFPQELRGRSLCQAVRFAQQHAYAFRHVEINCKGMDQRGRSLMDKQLVQFLEILTNFSQLSSVSFINMCDHSDWWEFEATFSKTVSFLQSQNKVESIEFKWSFFTYVETLEILRTIFVKGSGTLKRLILQEFSEDTFFGDLGMQVIRMPSTQDILMKLQKIEIDYSDFFENLIKFYLEYGNSGELSNKIGMLEEMKVNCIDVEYEEYEGISPDAWKYFAKIHPSLRIHLIYREDFEDENKYETFIVRHMPIKLLDFRYRGFGESGLGRLLSHLLSCEINNFLEEMIIIRVPNNAVFTLDLINFLQTCPRLSILKLYIKHPVKELDVLFNNLQYNKPASLERFSINIANVCSKQEELYYLNMSDYFTPLLLAIKLRLILRTEISDSGMICAAVKI